MKFYFASAALAVLLCECCGSPAASATTIALNDAMLNSPAMGSFQSNNGASGGYTPTTAIAGWTISGNGQSSGVLNYTAASGSPTTEAPYFPSVTAGTTIAYGNASSTASTPNANGVITQFTTGADGTITPGTTYNLTVSVGQTVSNSAGEEYEIALVYLSGGIPTILGSAATGVASSGSLTPESVIPYTAPGSGAMIGQQIGVLLEALNTAGVTVPQTDFSNVVLTSVPEPGSLAIVGVSSLLLLARHRLKYVAAG